MDLKMKRTLLIAAGAASLFLVDAAAAQTSPPPPPPPGGYGAAAPAPPPGYGPGPRFDGQRRLDPQAIERRNAEVFARMDLNHDGRVTFEEFRQVALRRAFDRFSGGADSFTLDQMNARAVERLRERGARRGFGPGGPPPPPPAPPVR